LLWILNKKENKITCGGMC